jgi:L-amino acid N-acyltransferase YncA
MAPAGGWRVREASTQDGAACAELYAPYVIETAITFETEPPSAAQMGERIAAAARTHAWLVLEQDGRVAGWAYGGPFDSRAAYRWTCEVSVYIERSSRGRGGGRLLYEELLQRLAARGFRMAVARIALPNDASQALHRAVGFEPVGVYRNIGYKHGRWHDVALAQRSLDAGDQGEALALPR